VELLACARHEADLLAHPYIGVEPVLLAAARLGVTTPRTGLFFQRRPKDCLIAAGDLEVRVQRDAGRADAKQPGFNNSLDGENTRKGLDIPIRYT
jgi:hypothetical protein